MSRKAFIAWFEHVGREDIPFVGGKGANLGEMIQAGIPVPPGFIITAPAYFHFIHENRLERRIREVMRTLNVNSPHSLHDTSQNIKKLIKNASLPKDLAVAILKAYETLSHSQENTSGQKKANPLATVKNLFEEPLVAVRSSATAEDLPTASFAGQQATFLNVHGQVELLEKVKECYASLFEARAIFYRQENKFDHFRVGIAVPVQKMVQSSSSGVMFTIDPVTNEKSKIVIEAILGLGELIVQGAVTPDHFEVDKKKLMIIKKHIARQVVMLTKSGRTTKEVKVPRSMQQKQKISDEQVATIAKFGKKIEHHYYFPQDIEWAIEDGKVSIVQTRPITTIKTVNSEQKITQVDFQAQSTRVKVFLKGDPASPGIGCGPVKIILTPKEIGKIKQGEVLVATKTNPDYVPAMRKACAIVTDQGGRTSHAAIVSRELGIPCVVGTGDATKTLKTGLVVTVNGATGEVFKGALVKGNGLKSDMDHATIYDRESIAAPPVALPQKKTATKLYVNLAEVERAKDVAKLHVDGVGLLRAEFMIAAIGIHPQQIIKEKKQKLFIDKLAEKLTVFCKEFNPRPVVYRLSDFKTNEYRNLKGGAEYEPQEENPMLGFRGAYRFIVAPNALELEIEAIKKVRNVHKLKNLWLMIPYVRTVEELAEMKKLIASFGLNRSPDFKLWMMVEIPSNVILLEDFINTGIDGVSIGSNDLTMLTLGTDRDNSKLATVFSERDPAVLWALERVIKTCHKHKITSSICGQAPSLYPDLVDKLIHWGITSLSLNADVAQAMRQTIYKSEKKLLNT